MASLTRPDAGSSEAPAQPAPALRPITPQAIVARNLAQLAERVQAGMPVDAGFRQLLDATVALAGGLDDYLTACSTPPSSVRAELAAEVAVHDWHGLYAAGATLGELEAEMLSGHLEGQLLKMLVEAARATRVLEIGLFAGYSALAMAEALPADGRLVACEIDPYAARYAQGWFDRSPHGRKIAVHVAPALETLERLAAAGERFDFIFIDADKGGYRSYLDLILARDLLADGGTIGVDNTLMQGGAYAAVQPSGNARAIAEFNAAVVADPRLEAVLLPVRDGVTLIRRAAV